MATENDLKTGDNPSELDIQEVLNNPQVKKIFEDMLDEKVKGLQSKNSELLGKLKKQTEAAKKWENFDLDEVSNIMDRIKNDEETRLLAEGKVDEVVSRRIGVMQKDFQSQVEARDIRLKELEGVIESKQEKLKALVIDGQIREAYVSLGYEPAALDDVIRLGRSVFEMDEKGKAVPRDDDGNLLFGKDGRTVMSAQEWLQQLSDKKPYLKRPSSGGGASNSGRSISGFDPSTATSRQKIAEGLRKLGRA